MAEIIFNPIENKVVNGGLSAIFRTIGCVGDSLSSGEHVSMKDGKAGFHDYYEYSWGQYIARATGATVYNFSAGGMSTTSFQSNKARLGFLDPDKKCQAYIVALGVNDALAKVPTGTIKDIHPDNPELNNPDTYAGRLGKIISEIKEIQPKARVFLTTCPNNFGFTGDDREKRFDEHRALAYEIAELFEFTYVIDLRQYTPSKDHLFWRGGWMTGHLNAVGYLLVAEWIMSCIDHIIETNPDDFAQVGFIGRENDLHNDRYKW